MKGVVGFMFFMLFLAGFALVLLQGRQSAETNLGEGAAAWAGVEWRPVLIAGDAVPQNSRLVVRFVADGEAHGFAGCNEFRGSLQRASSGITIGPLSTTRKVCSEEVMGLESAFLDALQSAAAIEASAGELKIIGENDQLLLDLRPATAR